MKIAIMHYSAPPVVGGVESVIAHHARMMVEAGHDVTIFCGRGESTDEKIPVKIHPLFDSSHDQILALKKELDKGICPMMFDSLKKQIQKLLLDELMGFDVLIAHNVVSLNKNLALTAAIFESYRTQGFPRLILWHHDIAGTTSRYQNELYDGYPWQLLRQVWAGVTNVTISQTRRREFAKLTGASEQEIRVIPNGVDLEGFYKFEQLTIDLVEKADLLDADPLLLLPVRLTARKNVEMALHIMAALQKDLPKVKLLITGPEGPHNPSNRAYREKLFALRDQLHLHDAAIFLAEMYQGFVPDAVIADFFRLADGLLFTSKEEGFGIPLLEAGISRQPVFCADIPVLRELGRDFLEYFALDEKPENVAVQIREKLWFDSSLRWSRFVKLNYTWRAVYQNYIEHLLKEVSQ